MNKSLRFSIVPLTLLALMLPTSGCDEQSEITDTTDEAEPMLLHEEALDNGLVVSVFGEPEQPGAALMIEGPAEHVLALDRPDLSPGERYALATGEPAPYELAADGDRPIEDLPQTVNYGFCSESGDFLFCEIERTTDYTKSVKTDGRYHMRVCKNGDDGTVDFVMKRSGNAVMTVKNMPEDFCFSYDDNPWVHRTYTLAIEESNASYNVKIWGRW